MGYIKKAPYYSLRPQYLAILSFILIFFIGSMILVFSYKTHIWKDWPLLIFFFLGPLIGIMYQLVIAIRRYKIYSKKLKKKFHRTFKSEFWRYENICTMIILVLGIIITILVLCTNIVK